MKNVLKYPGSKTRIADWICRFIPEHSVYLELFFGGGAVFFNKEPARIETINDLSGEVVNYFKVLRDCPEDLILLLELTPYSRDEYNRSFDSADSDIERARRFAVRCCQGFGCSNRYKNGFPDVLREASERLKNAQIENQDALKLLDRYNKEEVFVYADPPYMLNTRKGYLYEHEMTDEQHEELLITLLKFNGKVMISGYENDLYNHMLKDWRKEKLKTTAECSVSREETIWMNYQDKQLSIL